MVCESEGNLRSKSHNSRAMNRTRTLSPFAALNMRESTEAHSATQALMNEISFEAEVQNTLDQSLGNQCLHWNNNIDQRIVENTRLDPVNNYFWEHEPIDMLGYQNVQGQIDQAMAQMDNFMNFVMDQIVYSNTGQGGYVVSETSGDGWKTTTVTNSNGEHRQTNTSHSNGYSSETLGDNDPTYKDPDGNETTEEDYCEGTGGKAGDCDDEPEGIIAETEWPMGYGMQSYADQGFNFLHSYEMEMNQPVWIDQSFLF